MKELTIQSEIKPRWLLGVAWGHSGIYNDTTLCSISNTNNDISPGATPRNLKKTPSNPKKPKKNPSNPWDLITLFYLLQGDQSQLAKSIKLLLLDAISQVPGITCHLKYYV